MKLTGNKLTVPLLQKEQFLSLIFGSAGGKLDDVTVIVAQVVDS